MKMNKTDKKHTSRFTIYSLVLLTILLTTVVLFSLFTIYSKTQMKAVSQPTFLYVQTAHSGTLSAEKADGKRILTLNDVSPTTVYFSDRPDRITGHESTEDFIAQWNDGEDSFASNPPNAALDVIDEDSQHLAIVELMGARYDAQNKTLEYEILMLDNESQGAFPTTFGEAAVFIDSKYIRYGCGCDSTPGNTCSCEYTYTLDAGKTKEIRAYCLDDRHPPFLEVSGNKGSTTCVLAFPLYPDQSGYSCINRDTTSSDQLDITVTCNSRR